MNGGFCVMNSFIAWVGGKKLLRKEIVSRFPEDFDRYAEVFGGAAWVLFYKEKGNHEEVYNDINGELVNLFRCVKYHPEAIEKELKLTLNSREVFENYKSAKGLSGMTDIQRASRYLYLIRASYGAKIENFGMRNRDITDVSDIYEIKNRLAKVVIEHKSYEELIRRYDKPKTLFYCDPPYHKTEHMYDTGDFVFDDNQHINLRNTLSRIKGKFILSYNDDDFIRELYKNYNITSVKRSNNLGLVSGKNKEFSELIITNY